MDPPISERPLPGADRDSLPWWEALARHEFLLQRCRECRRWRWPARAMCNRCASFRWEWEKPSGKGTIASWIVTRHAFLPGFTAPYAVLTVRLHEQDDILMPGGYAGSADDPRLAVDAPVLAGFDDIAGSDPPRSLLRWTLAP